MVKRSQTVIIRLPKSVRLEDVDVKSIPIDDSWRVQVKDGDRSLGEMSFGTAKVKFGRG